ncbi:MAG: histidine--tRNA ligase [Thermoanaerobaculia bacterium]|nr:histidine--tRNA ligase [Thermoanaerobaculia bacterium]
MAQRFQAPKGTRDILPADSALWAAVEAVARAVFGRYGFREIRTPIFEETELFARGVGESSDIVGKEMYSFVDKGDRNLTLRPENTAAVVRAYVEHGMARQPQPVKLFYIGPQFRYERPQKGRYRQFHQIGAELLGGKGAESDAEVLLMLVALLGELGFRDLKVLINTVGDEASRSAYREALVGYLESHREKLSDESLRRLSTNPLRILDSKSPQEQELLAGAPQLRDSLTGESRAHFAAVCAALQQFDVAFEVSPRLVRGLDYYTNTVFEIVSEGLGSQNAICGGGAYEGLVEELGGSPTYGVGFAIGEDRLLDVLPADSPARRAGLFLSVGPVVVTDSEKLPVKEGETSTVFGLVERLRRSGIPSVEGAGKQEKVYERAVAMLSPAIVYIGERRPGDGACNVRILSTGERLQLDESELAPTLKRFFPFTGAFESPAPAMSLPADAVADVDEE